MNYFQLDSEDQTPETAIHVMVARLKERFPKIDAVALEAAMMLELAHSALADMRMIYWSQFGLTGKRFALLRLLYLAERNLTIGEIASGLKVGTNNISQLIDAAVRDGLVERVAAEDDRRVVYAVLTQQGKELFENVFPRNAQRVQAAWSPLTDGEKKLLTDFMARLYDQYLRAPEGAG